MLSRVAFDPTHACAVDIARAFTRQLPLRLVWVSEELWDTEALLVHNRYHIKNDGTSEVGKIRTPQDLTVEQPTTSTLIA